MDLLYMFMGALCLAEGIALFTGKDFLMFVGSTKKEDYDLDKVFRVEKWVFTADAACSFGCPTSWGSGFFGCRSVYGWISEECYRQVMLLIDLRFIQRRVNGI